jgi:GNS1/SUR4 family
MMYSYYTLSLLRIQCPWKKYLTMAQLIQFTTVVIYSMVSLFVLPKGVTWRHYTALITQCGEMISLFLLFLHFYKKSYSKEGTAASKKAEGDKKQASTHRKSPSEEALKGSPSRTSETSDTGSEQSSLSSDSEAD